MTSQAPTKISNLESHIGYWLRYVSNHVSSGFARRLADVDVTVSEWVAMRRLYDLRESTQKELAQAMGMTKAPVSRILDRLVEKKLVRREESATDRRERLVKLTAAGRLLVPKLAKMADGNDDDFFACLSKEEQTTVLRIMQKLVKHHGLSQLPVD